MASLARTHRLLLAAALMLLGSATAAAKELTTIEVESPGFRIVGNITETQALEYLEQLRRFHQLVEVILKRPVDPASMPVEVYIANVGLWKLLRRSSEDSGYLYHNFSHTRAMVDGSRRQQMLLSIFYTYTHYFLSTQFPADYPPWYLTGLDLAMGATNIKGDLATVGIPANYLLSLRHGGQWIPIGDILNAEYGTSTFKYLRCNDFSAGSWALMHYGMVQDQGFARQIPMYLKARAAGSPTEAAVREAFGMDLRQLDSLIRGYAYRDTFSQFTVELPQLPTLNNKRTRTLDSSASTLELATFALGGSRYNKEIASMLDKVLSKEPENPYALALRALAAVREEQYAAAEGYVARAAAVVQPGDARTAAVLGKTLFRIAEQTGIDEQYRVNSRGVERLMRSREFYEKTLEADSPDREAARGFGMAGILAGVQMEPSIDVIKKACAPELYEPICNYSLAVASIRLGRKEDAQHYWTRTLDVTPPGEFLQRASRTFEAYGGDTQATGSGR